MSGIRYDETDQVVCITIEGENDLNILSLKLMDEFVDALVEFRNSHHLSVAVVTGAGERAFSAGGDLRGPGPEHPEYYTAKSSRDWFWWPHSGIRGTYTRMGTLEVDKPVIAAVNGYCLGGALIAVAQLADIRVAGEGAVFGLAETKRGMPGGAASAQLGRYLPHAVAMYMVLTGNNISAEEAFRYGFVNRLVAPADVLPTAMAIADEVSQLPIEVAKAEKEGAIRGRDLDREGAFRIAQYQYTIFAQDPAHQSGPEDFLQRKPKPTE